MYVRTIARGFCVGPCETTAECRGGMLCPSIVETLGVTADIVSRALRMDGIEP